VSSQPNWGTGSAIVSNLFSNICISSPWEASALLFVQFLLVRSLAKRLLTIGQTKGFVKQSTLSNTYQVFCRPASDFASELW